MGIRVCYDIDERVAIPAKSAEACLMALRELRPNRHFPTLIHAFKNWGFDGHVDEEGATHLGEMDSQWWKLSTEDELFDAIAPFLPNFSKGDEVAITAVSDEGEHWRWLFVTGRAFEQGGKIVYAESPEVLV